MVKNIKIVVLVIVFTLLLSSCTKNNTDNQNEDKDNSNNQEQKEEVVGKLYEINDKEIKIVTLKGELKNIEIPKDKLDDFFIGEMIKLNPVGDSYDVSLYKEYNFDKRLDDAGNQIKRVTAKVKDVGEDFINIMTDDGEVSIMNPGNFALPQNSNVIFDYTSSDKGNTLVSYYDEGTKLDLVISDLSRDSSGELVIKGKDDNENEYQVVVKSDVLLNVTASNLKDGDKIFVYPMTVSDDNPKKVESSMILKYNDTV